MTISRPGRVSAAGRWGSVFVLSLLVGLGLAGARSPAAAQAERLLSERELEYQSASKEYEARWAAWDAQRSRFQNAVDEVAAAKRSGSAERRESAYQAVTTLAVELARLDRRVQEAARTLDQERQQLLGALDSRRRGLEDQFSRARTPEQQRGLGAQLRDLENQYRSLTEEAGGLRATLVFWPEVNALATDGAEELRAKVGILERQVGQVVLETERVDEEIARLEGRLRLERFGTDARTSRDRFGDTNVPVGPQERPGRPGVRAAADTTGVPLHERPLDEQIAYQRSYKSQLELMRAQLEARATSIRARLPRTEEPGRVP